MRGPRPTLRPMFERLCQFADEHGWRVELVPTSRGVMLMVLTEDKPAGTESSVEDIDEAARLVLGQLAMRMSGSS